MRLFRNRTDAGHQLAKVLAPYTYADGKPPSQHNIQSDVIVLGLARGGVPVAYEIAHILHRPLGVMLVRKLGVPGHEELAMGAVASGNVRILNEDVIQSLAIPDSVIENAIEVQLQEIARREAIFGAGLTSADVAGKTVILADDGVATGATMRAAIAALRAQQPARIVVAIGVAPPDVCQSMASLVDEFICLLRPRGFWSVGMWYEDFSQLTDEDVRALFRSAKAQRVLIP
ncbi:MAG: phosphoribosyltransferase [Caldilineaceae bacterium]